MIIRRLHASRPETSTWLFGSTEDGTAALIQPEYESLTLYQDLAQRLNLRITEVLYNRVSSATALHATATPGSLATSATDPLAEALGATLIRPLLGPQDVHPGLVTEVVVQVGGQVIRLKRFGTPNPDALAYPIAELEPNVYALNLSYDVLTLQKGTSSLRLMGSRMGNESRLIGVVDGHVFTGGAMPKWPAEAEEVEEWVRPL